MDFGEVLATLCQEADTLAQAMRDGEGSPAAFENAKASVEAMQQDRFLPLIDARGRVQVKYGMAGYAELFGPLSAGERKLARVWAAASDRHWPEARTSAAEAAESLRAAREVLEGLMGKAA